MHVVVVVFFPSPYADAPNSKFEEEIEAIMAENERKMNELRQSYEDRLKQETQANEQVEREREKRSWLQAAMQCNPFLANLNFDEQLMNKIIFIIQPGRNLIGKGDECTIHLLGPGIQDHHATINRTEADKIVLEACGDDCKILLNGESITRNVNLNHNDRFVLGEPIV